MHDLGPFTLIETIGRGGMGTVWRAVHRKQQVPVAVKFVLNEAKASDALLDRFGDEVRAVAAMNHPNIVGVFDYGSVPESLEASTDGAIKAGTPWLAMELLSGGTVGTNPPKNWAQLRAMLRDILHGLAAAHAVGVLHRDLKPDNILLAGAGDLRPGLRLVDFGLAFLDDGSCNPQEQQKAAGTPRYMAPEQLRANWRDFGPWTDLYALGCLAWQLATGATPFHHCNPFLKLVRAHMHMAPPAFRPLFKVPPGFESWLRTLLAKRRTDRFRFAADALAALPEAEHAPEREFSLNAIDVARIFGDQNKTITVATGDLIDDTIEQTMPSLTAAALGEDEAPRSPILDETIPEIPDEWFQGDDDKTRLQLLGVGQGLFGLRAHAVVGRVDERDMLWRSLRDVRRSGAPKLVLLSGPPGAGKATLSEWLAQRVHELGVAVPLRVSHDPSGTQGRGLSAMVAHTLRCDGLRGDELTERLTKLLGRQVDGSNFEADALARLLDDNEDIGDVDLSITLHFQGPDERIAVLMRFLEREAAQRPVVLFLNDVQWGDEALLLAKALQQRTSSQPLPVLVVMTLRDDLLDDRPMERALLAELDLDAVTTMPISPLSNREQADLVQAMLGLEPELAERVVARSQGNPLFAVELVGDWVQRGVLEVGDAGFRLKLGEKAEIPRSIHQMWADRIEALLAQFPDESDETLELAAVLGLEVDREEWLRACREGCQPPSPDMIRGLLRRRLAITTRDGAALRHAHGMLRESLLKRAKEAGRWAIHHRRCAAMLSQTPAKKGLAERRSQHLLGAGDHRAALQPLLAAANERKASSDLRRAEALVDMLLRACDRLGLSNNDAIRLQAELLGAELDDTIGDAQKAAARASSALRRADLNTSPELGAMALLLLGSHALRAGKPDDSWRCFERALALSIRAKRNDLEIRSHFYLADQARRQGRFAVGAEHGGEGLRLAKDLGSALLIATAHFTAGMVDHSAGRLEPAAQHYRDAAEQYGLSGDRLGAANCANALGNVARQQGRIDEAVAAFHEAMSMHQSVGSTKDVGPMMSLALAQLDTGDFASAQLNLEAGCARFDQQNQLSMLACARACLLPCYAHDGDDIAFDAAADEAERLLEQTGMLSSDVAQPIEQAASILEAKGQSQRAATAWRMAIAQWRGLKRPERAQAAEARLRALA